MNRSPISALFCLGLILISCKDAKNDATPQTDPVSEGETSIVVSTWNVAWLHSQDDTGEIRREQRDYDRLAEYVRAVDADIFALQELYGTAAAKRIFDPHVYDFHFPDDDDLQQVGFAYKKTLKVIEKKFYNELGLGYLRPGADLTVSINGVELRLLAVHLKSGCFGPAFTDDGACKVLKRQLPILEKWIDSRAAEQVPFVVLGDYNRRFEAPDPFWPEIDDADPSNADLTSVTQGKLSECWQGRYPNYIDHIVLDKQSSAWQNKGSFKQHLFRQEHSSKKHFLSDHCPVSVELTIP